MICQTCGQPVEPHSSCLRCGTPAGQPPVWPTVPTRTVAGVGTAACVLVGAATVATVLTMIVLPVINGRLARRAMETLDVVPLGVADLLAMMVTLLQRGLFVAAIVLFLVWMWRAHKNLYAFPGVGPTMGAGWSIGGWFIPLANLVIPFIAMNDIARGSLTWREREPRRTDTQPLVGVWWATWVVSVCGFGVATFTNRRDAQRLPMLLTSRDDFQRYVDYYASVAGRSLISAVALVVAAVLAIILIRRISRAQAMRIARAYQLGGMPTYAAGPPPAPAVPAAPPGPAAPSSDAAAPSPDLAAQPSSPEAPPVAEPGTPT